MSILRHVSGLVLAAILIAACTGSAIPSPITGASIGGAGARPLTAEEAAPDDRPTAEPIALGPAPSPTFPPLPLTGGGTPAGERGDLSTLVRELARAWDIT